MKTLALAWLIFLALTGVASGASCPAGSTCNTDSATVASNTDLKAATAATAGYASVVYRAGFAAAGDGGDAFYKWSGSACSLNSGAGDNGSQVAPNAGGGCWLLVKGESLNPLVWGADPTGVADSAPPIRAMLATLGTNGRIVFPPGLYNLCSTLASPYPAGYGLPSILVQGKNTFSIDFGGASFRVCDAIANSSTGLEYWFFDNDHNFQVYGGNFIGNMTGKTGSALSNGISLTNVVNFSFIGQHFTGDWSSLGGGGSAFAGDFLVNGIILAPEMENVSFCFDMAFLLNVAFEQFNGTGLYHGGTGSSCFSEFYNAPNAGINNTGYPITESSNVTVHGTARNFNTGWSIASGSRYTIDGFYSDNPGTATVPGFGGIISYKVAHPVTNVIVRGHYNNNGNPTGGGGGVVVVNGSGSDFMAGYSFDVECSSDTNVCLQATGTSNINNVRATVICRGAQTNCLDASMASIVNPTATASNVSLSNATPANITSLLLRPGNWLVSGDVSFSPSATSTAFVGAITTTSGTFPGNTGVPGYMIIPFSSVGITSAYTLGSVQLNLGAQTTVYLVGQCNFSSGTCTANGNLKAAAQ